MCNTTAQPYRHASQELIRLAAHSGLKKEEGAGVLKMLIEKEYVEPRDMQDDIRILKQRITHGYKS